MGWCKVAALNKCSTPLASYSRGLVSQSGGQKTRVKVSAGCTPSEGVDPLSAFL